jgi:2-methylcitrate dehydratase PrpD
MTTSATGCTSTRRWPAVRDLPASRDLVAGEERLRGLSESVNRFAAETRFADLPSDVVERGKRSVLDLIGCTVYGSNAAAPANVHRYVHDHFPGDEATIYLGGGRSSAFGAALANGATSHSTELAESFTRAFMHPSTSVIPVVLVLGEREQATGADLLTAVAVGYEILIRFGLAVSPEFALEQGMHPPASLAVFGATAASANLMRLTGEQTASSLGIAAGNAPTAIKAATDQQATVKDLYQAYSCALATMCVDLAALGLTGPADWMAPWVTAIVRTFRPEPFAGLAESWMISSGGLKFKLMPIMGMGQPVLAATRDLLLAGQLDSTDVTSIVVESSDRIFLSDVGYPRHETAMRASVPFLVAAAIERREAFLDDRYLVGFLQDDMLMDASIRALADKVELRADPAITATMEHGDHRTLDARVTIHFRQGEKRSAYHDIWPETSALSFADVADKFRAVTRGRLQAESIERVVDMVATLDRLPDVRDLVGLLA